MNTILLQLAKSDKKSLVTKNDGNLTNIAIEAIKRNDGRLFRPTYTSGSGRFTSNLSNWRVKDICDILGYKYEVGNDSPRGGKTGDFIKVSKSTFDKILSLIH